MSVNGVLISTFLSPLPSLFFFTFTLHAEKTKAAMMLKILKDRIRISDTPSFRRYVADCCAATRDARDRDRKMPAQRYLAEQRFRRADLRSGGRRERTEIVLHSGEILGYMRIPRRHDRGLCPADI